MVVLILSIVIFDYTRFGYDYKALKDGQKVAVNTGIAKFQMHLSVTQSVVR